MERDAKYAAVALFALVCVAAAFAFVWWYSGRGDRRDYDAYEIYFEGSVSGLSKGSPVRYLGVDVGRVVALGVDRRDPGRVKVVAEIDAAAPVSGATQAKLGLLGLTGLLYIDLQQAPAAQDGENRPLARGERYPVIASRKGTIEASVERLPEILAQVSTVVSRLEQVLAEENVRAISLTLAHLEEASARLPQAATDAQAITAELRAVARSTAELTARLAGTLDRATPEFEALLANARLTSERMARTADGIDRLLNANGGVLGRNAGASVAELQQLVVDARGASEELRGLARELRERPTSLLIERPQAGVEIAR